VAMKIVLGHDINQDGLIDCIDATLWFWYLFPDRSRLRIMRNLNSHTRFNHLYIAILINGNWYNIEPQVGWTRRSSMWMTYVWGARYDPRYSTIQTDRWEREIRRTQF